MPFSSIFRLFSPSAQPISPLQLSRFPLIMEMLALTLLRLSPDVPTFLVQLEPILVKNYNEGVVLLCKVQSNPLPQIQWHKNGHRLYNESNAENVENVISQDDYHSVLNSSLYIKALNKRGSRNYTCKFENTAGYKQAEIRIIVQCE